MSLVEFLRVQYIDLSEMVHNLKAVAIWQENTSKHCINDYCVSHFLTFLSAKVFPEWKLNPGFGTQKKCFFPLNKSIPSIEVTNTKILWTFFRDQILSPLNGAVPWIEVSQRRGSTVLSIWKRKLTVSSGIKYFLRRPFVQLSMRNWRSKLCLPSKTWSLSVQQSFFLFQRAWRAENQANKKKKKLTLLR